MQERNCDARIFLDHASGLAILRAMIADGLAQAVRRKKAAQWWTKLGAIRVFGDDPPEVRSLLRALRFWSLVERGPNAGDCWIWRGPIQPGTGIPLLHTISTHSWETAAQVAWRLVRGHSPQVHLYRTCAEPRCVNPDHRKRARPMSEEPRTTAMVALYEGGMTLDAIGAAFGLTRERVRQLIRPSEPATEGA